jgi:omega-amidase
MKVHLSRWVCLDADSNLLRAEVEANEAALGGARLVVFPENFLNGYTRQVNPSAARSAFERASHRHPETLFVFGSFTEERRNRLTAWWRGREVARYDKVHLFSPNREEALWDPGDSYSALRFEGLTIGFLNCNDLRFPEQARMLKLQGRCDMLVVPAWWPWRRDHVWRLLLRARSVENAVWVLGCCVSASDSPGESFAGAGNYVFSPEGDELRTPDDRSYTLDLAGVPESVVDPLKAYRPIEKIDVFEL